MSEETVRVLVRCRPLNAREKGLNCRTIVSMDSSVGQVSLEKPDAPDDPPKTFSFDGVFDKDSCSKQIYEDLVFPLVEGVLEGYNGTVFAYGQTGCGKSFSMEGIADHPEHRGITPRSFEHVFQEVAVRSNTKFLVRVSYLEIYNEMIRDLLSKDPSQKLELKEDPSKGVFVKDLSQLVVHNAEEVLRHMSRGTSCRSVGATAMNADSSRSHSIFTVYIEMCNGDGGEKDHIRAGKLNLVDLAGSERQSKTQAEGARLKEATKINLSLSALGNVISALVDGKAKHIPYRDSKLTRLLQDSLGGNTKTLMVACVSPADNNYDETLSTLRYANRAKNIKNKAVINEDPKDAMLREFQLEIARLKEMLMGKIPLDAGLAAGAAAAPKVIEKIVTKEVIVERYLPAPAPTSAPTSAPAPALARRDTAASITDEDRDAAIARIREEKAAELQRVEAELKESFDAQLEAMERMYKEQKITNERLEEEFARLSEQYNEARATVAASNQDALQSQIAAVSSLVVEDINDPTPTPTKAKAARTKEPKEPKEPKPRKVKVPKGAKAAAVAPSAGEQASAPAPVVGVAVLDESGAVIPAIMAEGVLVEARVTDGALVPVEDAQGRTRTVTGPQVMVIDEPIAVLGAEGPELAVRGQLGLPVRACMGADGMLHPAICVDGQPEPILGPDGAPAREVSMPPRGSRAVLRLKPAAVIGPDGQPVLAVLDAGIPVRAQLSPDGILVAVRGVDGKSIPIKGPDGGAARKLQSSVAAVAVVGPHGAVVGVAGEDGAVFRTELTGDGALRPVLGPDGAREVVQDVVIPVAAITAAAEAEVEVEAEVNDSGEGDVDDTAVPVARLQAVAAASAEAAEDSPGTPATPAAPVAKVPPEELVRQLQAKLHELEGKVVSGGEAANNAVLKETLDKKRVRAREKELERLKAAKEGNAEDEDVVLEEIYGTMQDELRAKSKKLDRARDKLKAARTEIADLQSEAQRDKDEMLDELRRQGQQLRLYQQLVERMAPLVRRDCNYYNVDRVITQAQWSEDKGEWLMPRVSNGGGSAGQRPPLQPSASDMATSSSAGTTRSAALAGGDFRRDSASEDDAYREHLRGVGESTYFASKRAAQLAGGMEQRAREMAAQQEARMARFDVRPLTSQRYANLMPQDALTSRDSSPRSSRRTDEVGGVSLAGAHRPLRRARANDNH